MYKLNFDLQLFAKTSIATDPALVQQYWGRKLWRSSQDELWWAKFIGNGPDFIIDKNTDLKKAAGDQVTIPLMAKLIGPAITGDNRARGNEEPMAPMSFSVTVDQYRKSIELIGKMDEQKTQIDLRTAAHSLLTTWMAEELIDQNFFTVMSANPSPNRIVTAGNRASVSLIQPGDKMSCALISQAKRKATLAGNAKALSLSGGTVTTTQWSNIVTGSGTNFTNDFQVGDLITIGTQANYVTEISSTTSLVCAAKWLTSAAGSTYSAVRYLGARSKLRPVKINGGKYFVMVIHPNQERDLQDDPTWIAANQSNAAWRQMDNPIFSGCAGVYMGVVIHTHDKVAVSNSGLNGTQVGSALFLGAQAGCMAVAREPNWVEDHVTIDYGNSTGFCTGIIYGVAKSNFNGEDFGCVTVCTAAVDDYTPTLQ